MLLIRNLYKKGAFTVLAVLPAITLLAQNSEDAPAAKESSDGYVQALLIVVCLILAFVIWGLGNVLTTLARKVLEKSKQAAAPPVILVMIFLLSGFSSLAQDAAAQAEKPAISKFYGGLSSFDFWVFVAVLSTELFIIAILLFLIRRLEKELIPAKAKARSFAFSNWWRRIDRKLFTKAVAVEKEADILLEHDYDGIQELDNSLPPWWKYGFYVTIGVAVIYLLNFHVFGFGKNPTQEYNEEMAKAKIEMEEYAAKNRDKIDEDNIQMPDAAGLSRGGEIYAISCWACHGKLGEGGAGPNLTDEYWLHKGALNDIYASIKHGYPEKGMQAWEKSFSPKEIVYLTGYVKSLAGTNPPNGKAPQGDLFVGEVVADSTALSK